MLGELDMIIKFNNSFLMQLSERKLLGMMLQQFLCSNQPVNITLALGPLPNGERIEARCVTVPVEEGSGAGGMICSDIPINTAVFVLQT